ncbi:MAG: hypothetical protein RIC35_01395 [Marinoscillum sp.]
MNIKYRKKRLRLNFVLAIVWLGLTIAQAYFVDNTYLLMGWIIIGVLNFSQSAYRYFMPYLTLKGGLLIVHEFLNHSSIELSESTRIKKFAGDYIFKNNGKELTVDTQLIEPTALIALNNELEKVSIQWV